jgi:hypothetical protein
MQLVQAFRVQFLFVKKVRKAQNLGVGYGNVHRRFFSAGNDHLQYRLVTGYGHHIKGTACMGSITQGQGEGLSVHE